MLLMDNHLNLANGAPSRCHSKLDFIAAARLDQYLTIKQNKEYSKCLPVKKHICTWKCYDFFPSINDEAYDFIKKMPFFEADATVLGACRLGGAIELGNEVAQLLLESQQSHSGHYVQLSSIYVGAERSEKSMLDPGIHKLRFQPTVLFRRVDNCSSF
ncbi:hypothetical protein MTR67_000473 [Solanum verrucosum]|uniref:Uncharacterized protein n=1 Tax=Solanum verrucosum TaxID=315347 RepID=A0AAF0T7H7_SOLVR|nr:hypothetical protein MTR67_000473 [Solanum verrucosum]